MKREGAPETSNTMAVDVREHLVAALKADLVGPFDASNPTEVLKMAPSRWYLTGFLAPQGDRDLDDPDDEETDGAGDDTQSDDANDQDPEAKRRRFAPASIGISVLLNPSCEDISATVTWADYQRVDALAVEAAKEGKQLTAAPARGTRWQRLPTRRETMQLPLDPEALSEGLEIPKSDGLVLRGTMKALEHKYAGVPSGTRALSVFVVNARAEADKAERDSAYAFQVGLTLEANCAFVARPNPRDEHTDEIDANIADLQFRHVKEYATGHGIAVETPDDHGRVVRTAWIPRAQVKLVRSPTDTFGVEIKMLRLAELESPNAIREALTPLVDAYRNWITTQKSTPLETEKQERTRDELMDRADIAAERILGGIKVLATDPVARRAFQLANLAMGAMSRQKHPERGEPQWRLFQLAFILLNIAGVVDDAHKDRDTVELIYFPTGGGKTEAYLGLIAFTLILRRLRGRDRPDAGLGVAVLLRYTLRLLTLDQLERAAALVCSLELLRRKDPAELGDVRFSVGLWVGSKATANTLKVMAAQIAEFKAARGSELPAPLAHCPWCKAEFKAQDFHVEGTQKNPTRVTLSCHDHQCDFSGARHADGLPVVFVDEQIYRELPGFVIGTVDKFALLPYRGRAGMLFGRATAREGGRFFGTSTEPVPDGATRLPAGLHPPELIVQRRTPPDLRSAGNDGRAL